MSTSGTRTAHKLLAEPLMRKLIASAVFILIVKSCLAADAPALAKQILDATQTRGGFVVHLGCGDAQLTRALRANASFQVQGLDRDAAKVAAARAALVKDGVYGDICIDKLDGNLL